MFNREGGSIPVVATFQEILGLPSVLFGVGLPDENAHAPNEKLDLGNFHGGIIASAYPLRRDRQDEELRGSPRFCWRYCGVVLEFYSVCGFYRVLPGSTE